MAVVALVSLVASACASRDAATDGGFDATYDAQADAAVIDEPKVWELDFIPRDLPAIDYPLPRDRDAPRCTPANAALCACHGGAEGIQVCQDDGTWAPCECARRVPPTPHPPRLVAPIHARMVSSQRPTLRWALPDGVTRARVELCDDRACARRITQAEVGGTSWRPPERLRPGVVFWRVTGLRADGTSAWTSATWEFGVRHLDSEVDTTLGTFKDFNGDTYDDLVVVSFAGMEGRARPVQFEVFFGGPGGLSMSRRALVRSSSDRVVHSTPVLVATGDVNGDGVADLLTGVRETNEDAQVLYGSRDGVLRSGPSLRGGAASEIPTGLVLGDFNGDGFDDAFLGLGAASACPVALHQGSSEGLRSDPSVTGYMNCENGVASSDIPTPITAGDVGGDGYTDFFTWAPRILTLFHGNPNNDVGLRDPRYRYLTYVGAGGLWVADVNSDGATDVFAAPEANAFYSHGGTLAVDTIRLDRDPPRGWLGAHTAGRPGDFNGNGRAEFPVLEYCDTVVPGDADAGRGETCRYGHLALYVTDDGGFSRTTVAPMERVASGSAFASPGDLDGDGVDELALEVDDRVTIWRLDAAGAWQPRGTFATVEGGVLIVH